MRFRLYTAAAVVLAAAPAAPAADDAAPWYPLKVGNTWTYRMGTDSLTIKVMAREKIGGVEGYKLESVVGGKGMTEHVVVKPDGIYRLAYQGEVANPPFKILPWPATKGATWDLDIRFGDQSSKGHYRLDVQDVTVPAGTYKGAFVVEGTDIQSGGNSGSTTMWLVKDVGVVKLRLKFGPAEGTFELEKFEPAK